MARPAPPLASAAVLTQRSLRGAPLSEHAPCTRFPLWTMCDHSCMFVIIIATSDELCKRLPQQHTWMASSLTGTLPNPFGQCIPTLPAVRRLALGFNPCWRQAQGFKLRTGNHCCGGVIYALHSMYDVFWSGLVIASTCLAIGVEVPDAAPPLAAAIPCVTGSGSI